MKNISIVIFIFLTNACLGQVTEDFHSDLTLWAGTTTHFIINTSHQLQLNNTLASASYIITPFAANTNELEWNVYVKQAFAGSGNNYGRVYLLSSQPNLTQATEGYYLQLGEAGSNDAVELFRQSGTTSVSVCRAVNGTIAAAFAIRIRVTRNSAGLWKVLIDYNGGSDYLEAASGIDATYSTGSYVGMLCVYTAGNATRFYFDDVYAGPPKPEVPPPDVAELNDVVINEFFPDPSPPVGLQEQEFVEIYNRSSKTFDLNGWKIGDATSLVSMPSVLLHPDEYVVITTADGLPSLNNGGDVVKIIDNHGALIDSISYNFDWYQEASKSGGGYSIERLNPETMSNDVLNWYVSQSAIGGTPGRRNSVFGKNPDSKAPVIIYIHFLTDSIVIKFSEPVVPVAIIGGFDVTWRADTTATVHLENLTNGSENVLKIDGIHDFAGNPAPILTYPFTYFVSHPVNAKDIVITEIMADPTPVVQLPEAEYIELFNRSANPISLSGWHLEDATTSAQLPSLILMPNDYLLLTSTTNASRFSKAVGVTSFPSLGNLGDRIVLRETHGVAIDSVVYTLSWYHDTEKSEGGWSLELIDVNNPCGEIENWTASENADGGTPGKVNSVLANKPDVTPPNVLSVTAISPDSLLITFNEKLKDPGTISLTASAALRHHDVIYHLVEPLQTRTLYSIVVADVIDCNGNRMEAMDLTFALPERSEPHDIIINEVLFNPRPGDNDFVELYNRSDKYVNLKNWKLSDELITGKDDVMVPGSYRLLNASVMSMPSLPDDEGSIHLIDNKGDTIDQFSYNDDMHSAILSSTEGVSLERISPDADNWRSANASAGYATPGSVNSNSRPSFVADPGTVSVRPEVVNPSGPLPFSQIFYHFASGDVVANVMVVDMEGRLIKTIASNTTLGAEGSFQWDGDRDQGGLARCGYYMVWFQAFDLEGTVTTYRHRVVVGF